MKKSILLLLALILIAAPASAKPDAKTRLLKDASGVTMSDYALTAGSEIYSEPLYVTDNIGFATILVTEDIAGGAGDVDISTEYSTDGVNFYPAYTTDMAGTISAEGNIVTALQNATRWIAHTVRMARYMRYKFDPDANSEVTAYFIFQRDR